MTDVIFVASRKAKFCTLVDGVIGGLGKVALVSLLAGAGAYGLFLASAIGTVLAAVASLLLIVMAMRVRFDLRAPLATLKPLLRFSGANYIGNVMNMLATLAIPIILLDRQGAQSAGYFFVVLQMAQIVYTAALALEQTFLTEGSRADADMRQLRRRSIRLLVLFFVVTAGILIGLGHWLLLAFGQAYYQHGYTSLVILVVAAAPISASYWFQTILRLAGKLRAVIIANVSGAIGTCTCVWIGSSHGLTGVAWGWLGGAVIAAGVAGAAALRG
jgi:O-antigen/teichoic acid export membrane protein